MHGKFVTEIRGDFGVPIKVSHDAIKNNIEGGDFIKKQKQLSDRSLTQKDGKEYKEGVEKKIKNAGLKIEGSSELNKTQEKTLYHAYKKEFEESDRFTSINLIKSFDVENLKDGVGMEGIFSTNKMALRDAQNISTGLINVMFNQLSSSLVKLKDLCKGENIDENQLKGTAKFVGKLAQSLGRLVPMATMGALKCEGGDAMEAEAMAKFLEKITKTCDRASKIEKMSSQKLEGFIKNINSLGTYKDDQGNVKLTMTDLGREMNEFVKESFKYEGTGAKLTAEKIGVDLRMNQMIDTIVDLMEDLDVEYEKYDAKLGFLFKKKSLNGLDTGLGAGFERARNTRNVMENIRNMPMFSEFKYADLNKNLTKTLFEGVLLDPKKNEEIPSAFYKAFEDSKKDVEEEIESAEINDKTDEVERLKGQKTTIILEKFIKKIEELEGFNLGENINVRQAAELLVAIDAKFDKLVEETGASKGGMRGRNGQIFNLRFNESTGAFNLQVEFHEKDNPTFKKFNVQTGSFEEVSGEELRKQLPNLDGILKEIAKNNTFAHSYQTNVTADHYALKKEWVDIINDPIKFLDDATIDKKELKGLIDKIRVGDQKELKTKILDAETKNKVFKEEKLGDLVKVEGNKYESETSFAGIIEDNGLRTICGPSGTTTDTIVGMFGLFEKDFIGGALKEFAESINGRTKNENVNTSGGRKTIANEISEILKTNASGKFNNFKKIFSSIANYMINGQYHSPGEVLSGLTTVALSIVKYSDNIDKKDGIDQEKSDDDKKKELEKLKVKKDHVKEFAVQADVICKVLGNKESAEWLFPNAA